MCRIYGYFNATVSANELRTVAALQRHGGPDGRGSARAPGWGVGNNRLAIVDLDGGDQPYELNGRITVVFNGEIYNHDELRNHLRGLGYTFSDRCDGGIIPALYATYGESFVDWIDGMYAVAVLDQRDEPTLLLATDHMGMKPLYYRWDPVARSLHFSSEIPALHAFGAVSTDMWTPGLDAYLASKTPFGEQTMFADIRVLPPATTMVCAFDQEPRLYRRRSPADEPRAADETAVAADVHDTLRAEIERLLIADVPTTVITSGGLDSSLVTALASESNGDLHSFNIAYTGSWPSDERHFASQVAERAGTIHHQVEIDPATFPSLIEDVVWHLGQPNADPITLSTYALFSAVHDAGFKVTLSGDAADEVFGGYSRMRAAADAAAEGRPWHDAYLDQLAVLPAKQRRLLYTEEYRAHLREFDPLPGEATERLLEGGRSVLERITDFELEHRLPAYHLRRVDHLSMASSVEVRLPFCQREVVRLGRRLPDRMRIRDGKVKRVLYSAAEGRLPDQVLNRPKQPFTLPITAMLAPGWPLWDFAREVLHDHRLRHAGQLAPQAVQDLFAAQQARPNDTTALTIWALMVHEVWAEQFQGFSRKPETLAVPA